MVEYTKYNPEYTVTINKPIDSFQDGLDINLICIQNDNVASFNGNVSNIVLVCRTYYTQEHEQRLHVVDSKVPYRATGTFVFTCARNDEYPCEGGLITITIENNSTPETFTDYVKIEDSYSYYHELPERFLLIPKNQLSISDQNPLYLNIESAYLSEKSSESDFGPLTPYSYYYDTKHHYRLPFSNISSDNYSSRLQLSKEDNPDVQLVSTTCLHVCRYSKSMINENGIIDLTGYIPTPLSFDRYEFWINGRYLTKKNVIITSPTTLQLVNLRSLRNFEVIELCDDYYQDSPTFHRSVVYETLDGKRCSSMKQVMLHNEDASKYIKQSIRFGFCTNNSSTIDTYLGNYVDNPNNADIEHDIMLDIIQSSSSYYDISINGTTVKNVLLDDLKGIEIDAKMMMEMLNDVWKYERLTDFDMDTSFEYVSDTGDETFIQLHCKYNPEDDTYDVHTSGKYEGYFSVYITRDPTADISDTDNTERIVTVMRLGVTLSIPSEYAGMYLKTTVGNDYILIE